MSIEEVNSNDQFEWRTHRSNFEKTICKWCLNNNIDFFGTYDILTLPKNNKAVKLTVFELMSGLEELQQLDIECNVENKKIFYITDNLVDEHSLKNIKIISVNELFGMISQFDIEYPNPKILYNCFMQRVDSVRQSWFYFLKHYNLLDKGYVSFLLYQIKEYADLSGIELYDFIHETYQLHKLPHFHQAYLDMREKVPFRNFEENNNLAEYLKECKYSLTLETYATQDSHVASCYTEKLQRAIQFPTINLLFSQQNSLSKLHNLGFDIDQHMLDIDKQPWITRQQLILDILINDSIEFNQKTAYDRAMHNKNKFKHYKDEFLKGNFYNRIFDIILET